MKNLVGAAKNLSRAQRSLSDHLVNFKFDCIGSNQVNVLPPNDTMSYLVFLLTLIFQTDDELVIAGSLKEMGKLIS